MNPRESKINIKANYHSEVFNRKKNGVIMDNYRFQKERSLRLTADVLVFLGNQDPNRLKEFRAEDLDTAIKTASRYWDIPVKDAPDELKSFINAREALKKKRRIKTQQGIKEMTVEDAIEEMKSLFPPQKDKAKK